MKGLAVCKGRGPRSRKFIRTYTYDGIKNTRVRFYFLFVVVGVDRPGPWADRPYRLRRAAETAHGNASAAVRRFSNPTILTITARKGQTVVVDRFEMPSGLSNVKRPRAVGRRQKTFNDTCLRRRSAPAPFVFLSVFYRVRRGNARFRLLEHGGGRKATVRVREPKYGRVKSRLRIYAAFRRSQRKY